MKKTALLLIGLTIALFANGQIIKIQGGTSISTLDWKWKGVGMPSLFNERLIGYSIFAGIDYFDKQYFNLSSNIGMIRKGGEDEIQLSDAHGSPIGTLIDKATLDYLSVNTTIDFKYRIKETLSPFISIGPRFDYLLNSGHHFDGPKEFDVPPKEFNGLKNTSIGLILGGGLKYDLSNLQLGLRADYYLDFSKVADWTIENTVNGVNTVGGGEISVNTFTINLTIGYRLK